MSIKGAWKLQEFIAHSGRVQCARFGEKSGQVLATGGDDRLVNIWRVGKANAMMSLTGHTSSVECLVFDKQEDVLVVGCAGGSIQVWNLEYGRMSGTLPGHQTGCSTVEFHPYGDFFASGSLDTNLKIWDLRRKSCIQTYPGHSAAISAIRFSPHGRWVATGGLDNRVKIWDLTAGKQMKDFDLHKGAITSLAFHPKEFLLASGSLDRTVKLWNLETFLNVGSSQLGTSSVQAVKFHTEEKESAVLSVSQDSLRLHPCNALSTQANAIDVDWAGLQDLRLCYPEKKLLAVNTDGSQLSIWVADLQKRDLSGRGGPALGTGLSRPPFRGEGTRAAPPNAGRLSSYASGSSDGADETFKRLQDPESQQSIDQEPISLEQVAALRQVEVPATEPSERLRASGAEGSAAELPARASDSERPGIPDLAPGLGSPQSVVAATPSSPSSSSGCKYPGGNAEKRLYISSLSAQHPQMVGVLQRRLEQTKRIHEFWLKGNLASIGSVLHMPQDQAVLCDLCRSIKRKGLSSALNLDACLALLPLLRELMTSKYDDFVMSALEFSELLLEQFGKLIRETRERCSKIPERHMDLAQEERYKKCNACYDAFREIQILLFPEGCDSALAGRFRKFRTNLQVFLMRREQT